MPRRRQLRLLAWSMVAYGLVGLLLAVVGTLLAAELNSQIDRLASGVTERVGAIEQALHSTSVALDGASLGADSFADSLQQTTPTLDQARATLSGGAGSLREASAATADVAILGQRPLAGLSVSLAQTADGLDRLSEQVRSISGAMSGNQVALRDLSAALHGLASDVQSASTSLEVSVNGGLEAEAGTLPLLLVGLAGWLALPALAALSAGLWLLRAVAPRSLPAGAPEGTAGA